jgi:hypothetical protein
MHPSVQYNRTHTHTHTHSALTRLMEPLGNIGAVTHELVDGGVVVVVGVSQEVGAGGNLVVDGLALLLLCHFLFQRFSLGGCGVVGSG